MRIYTKSGDKGETGLIGGIRVSKTDPRICAIGEVDELNASLGVLQIFCNGDEFLTTLLEKIQNDLFNVGADLANPDESKQKITLDVPTLEKVIDELEAKLPPLKNFILPGGTPFSSHAHLSRAVCRRAERAVVALNTQSKEPSNNLHIIEYLNRLSDLLFMLARHDMATQGTPEKIWKK